MRKYLIHTKPKIVLAIFTAIILFGTWAGSIYTSGKGEEYTWMVPALMVIIMLGMIFEFKVNRVFSWILSMMIPVLGFYLLEAYIHSGFEIVFSIQLLNIVLYVLIFAVMAVILGNCARASVVVMLLLMGIGLTNYYAVCFRSSPILPWDLLSVRTALSVSGNYTFKLPQETLLISLCFVALAVIGSKCDLEIKGIIKRLFISLAGLLLIFLYALAIQTETVGDFFGLDDILFTPNNLYKKNGFMVSFTVNLQYLKIDEPEGYTNEALNQLTADTGMAFESAMADGTKQYPNIVVIMNEAFSDIGVLNTFDTNEDYMPFIHSLQQGAPDTVSGNLYVSVCGGNTANTEYEFLTGNSMAFLPEGSVAYQQYINDVTPSLAWQLKNLGYDTTAMHPYYAAGWDRDEVYPYFGFNQAIFKEQMAGASLLRKYISDEATYEMIKNNYNVKDEKPLFTFEVTMQNHGGYFDAYENFSEEISLQNVTQSSSKEWTDQYLSLIKASDEAFEGLIRYFETYDEPTIVVMFGDHQPGDYAVKSIYEFSENPSIEEKQKRYTVPFIMWANYDIEEEKVDKISANYLSTLMLQKAGIPLSGYQEFLAGMYQVMPVINANGVIDSQNIYYEEGEATPYDQYLKNYSILQYNLLFDSKNRVQNFYGFY